MSIAVLHSIDSGELLAAEINISSRLLEDILEALASAPFPINPELDHSSGSQTLVRFPLYESQIPALRETLAAAGFSPDLLHFQSMAATVAAYET
ncbi:MAG: hypothetical protein ACK6DZ_14010, partial [Acidobacteriota bacterium]